MPPGISRAGASDWSTLSLQEMLSLSVVQVLAEVVTSAVPVGSGC